MTMISSFKTSNTNINLLIYESSNKTFYNSSPNANNFGQTVNFTISKTNLQTVTNLTFLTTTRQVPNSNISVRNLIAAAKQITANLVISNTAFVGNHTVRLMHANETIDTTNIFDVRTVDNADIVT